MLLHKHLLAALIAALLLGYHDVSVAQLPTSTNAQAEVPRMTEATIVPGEIIGNEQILRAYISFGTNEFMFIVPEDVMIRFPQRERATLTGGKDDFSINFRLLGRLPHGTTTKQELRTWVKAHYTSPLNIEEFGMPVAGHEAVGLQFRQNPQWNVNRFVKIIWTPCQTGILEFILVSDVDCMKAGQLDFDAVLATFSTNEQGKIKIVPRLNET